MECSIEHGREYNLDHTIGYFTYSDLKVTGYNTKCNADHDNKI